MLDTLRILVLISSLHTSYLQDLKTEGILIQKHEIEFRFESMSNAEGRCDKNGDHWRISIDPWFPESCLKMLIYHELSHAYFELADSDEIKIMDYHRIMMKFKAKDWKELVSEIRKTL